MALILVGVSIAALLIYPTKSEIKIQVLVNSLSDFSVSYNLPSSAQCVFFGQSDNVLLPRGKVSALGRSHSFSQDDSSLCFDKPVSAFQIRFAVEPIDSPASYLPFHIFSDGSFSLFLPYINITRLDDSFSASRLDVSTKAISFILDQVRYAESGKNIPVRDVDAYVYFGSSQLKSRGTFSAIFDPKLSPAIAAFIEITLNELMMRYTSILVPKLRNNPSIFVGFNKASDKFDISADVVGGKNIYITLGGSQTLASLTESWKPIALILAHELSHLWNGGQAQNTSARWLHEGMSDILAIEALVDLGFMSINEGNSLQQAAIDRCASHSDARVFLASGEVDFSSDIEKAHYDCGASVYISAVREAETMRKRMATHDIWNELISLERDDAHSYSKEDLMKVFTKHNLVQSRDLVIKLESKDCSSQCLMRTLKGIRQPNK